MLYCTHSRTHYCFLLTSTIWESLLDRNHCFGRPSPAAVSQLKHAHPQQVVPHCEIFMSDWPHMHVQAHVLITLSCTSEEGEGSGLALTHAACETPGRSHTMCRQLSVSASRKTRRLPSPLALPISVARIFAYAQHYKVLPGTTCTNNNFQSFGSFLQAHTYRAQYKDTDEFLHFKLSFTYKRMPALLIRQEFTPPASSSS